MMLETDAAAEADAFTKLILSLFRLNGVLLAEGDRLSAPEGLSSARWQVMGAIDAGPDTVSGIARRMGRTRQSVQRTVNDLLAVGAVTLRPNPHHRRARLVDLTQDGRRALDHVSARQRVWAAMTAAGMGVERLNDAVAVLDEVRHRLEGVE